MNVKQLAAAVLVAGAVGAVTVSGAVATPPSADPPEASDLVSGQLVAGGRGASRVAQDGVELKVKQPTTVATFDLTYEPLEYSGWHSHPGIVVVVVRSGTVERTTVTRGGRCATDTFTAGQSFTEVGAHHVANPSATESAVLSITRLYPSSATQSRIDEPAPSCR